MAEPDLSSFDAQERATFWTGAIVRNAMLLEVTLRTILRSLGRRHPADPVPDEPAEFEALRLAVAAGVAAKFQGEPLGLDIAEAVDEAGAVHRSGRELLARLWGVLEGSDVFQVLDLLPSDPERRAPAEVIPDAELRALRLDQVRAYVRLGGVEKMVRHASYDAPFDAEADAARRIAQVRGEFDVLEDGTLRFRGGSLAVDAATDAAVAEG